MLNTDKESLTLGFECYEGGKTMSFEGLKNYQNGSAARFIYNENIAEGAEVDETGGNVNLMDLTNIISLDWDNDFDNLWNTHKNTIAIYLSRGFEFRFPKSTDFLNSTNTEINSEAELYLKEFFRMWREIALLDLPFLVRLNINFKIAKITIALTIAINVKIKSLALFLNHSIIGILSPFYS